MGKSWLAKTLIMGLLCARIADAVVLDRDGDYDAIHEYLKEKVSVSTWQGSVR